MTSPAAPLLSERLRPLRALLGGNSVEDVAINRPGEAWVREAGEWVAHDVDLQLADLEEISILAGSLRRQDVGDFAPLCSAELPGGERLQVVLPPQVPIGTISLTIRKPSNVVPLLQDLAHRYCADDWHRWHRYRAGRDMGELLVLFRRGDLQAFLRAAVHARLNILATGPTGSGKTELSKLVISEIDPGERLITIEDTLELELRQPNTVRLLYSKDDPSEAPIGAEGLLEAALRMRPDRIILQELREERAAYVYMHQVATGHPGSITTVHGYDAATAFQRLFALCKGSPSGRGFDDNTLVELLAGAVDVIIPLHNAPGSTTRSIGRVWFVADAGDRGETAASLLRQQ